MSAPADKELLLQVQELTVEYPAGRGRKVHAVSGVDFTLAPGEILGLVGESGCGKSSLARAVMQLPAPTSGRVLLEGNELTGLSASQLRALRSRFQMIFQDPVSSLNPSRSVGESIAAPLRALGGPGAKQVRLRVEQMLAAVGLDPQLHYDRRPHQLSGGQCQRVSIARALMSSPQLLVCDEPVSALDVSVQAQILNLLRGIRKDFGVAMLFIAHDLAVVKNICDRVAVMYLGVICEIAPAAELYRRPAHPYTAALLAAVPRPDPLHPLPSTGLLPGELPSATDPPSGCRFRTRCPAAQSTCAQFRPQMRPVGGGHFVACHYPLRPASTPGPSPRPPLQRGENGA
jgi:peptide/nickel transport system ATP-binding protein